ncbi:MAG: serine protease [Burkholderiales bacterium]|jgi:S1-C subfamily serine protease|nr:serine protease [Burkholderiales bacterium]MBL6878750.1 serine protease [Burkholderiales bacterium]MBT5951082.1 serine protease [Betaproteobacteria bacterium]MDC0500419.1 S1C family serine protease [Burkholderiales bacterium]
MENADEWKFPHSLRPNPEKLLFNLDSAINSVVKVRTSIPAAAFTADVLGTERIGSGVLINNSGLILTVGYLVTEAETVWLTTNLNQSIPGHVVAYDQSSGLGLVQALGSLDIDASELDSSDLVTVNDDIFFISYGGIEHSLCSKISRIDEFAGYWEYLLEAAIYTSPPHPQWGGAAVFNKKGHIIGIGSLFLQEIFEGQNLQGNLAIPTSILKSIMGDMLEFGRSSAPARPWLGMYAVESEKTLTVNSLARYGPAELAGVLQGDKVVGVGEESVSTLANFFRSVWTLGAAGVSVPININRNGNQLQLVINSIDRNDFLLKPQTH